MFSMLILLLFLRQFQWTTACSNEPRLLLRDCFATVNECQTAGCALIVFDQDADDVTISISSYGGPTIFRLVGRTIFCGNQAGDPFTPQTASTVLVISLSDNACPPVSVDYTLILTDYTPSTPTFSTDIFKDIFLTGTPEQNIIALDTTDMGINTVTDTVTLGSSTPAPVPLQLSGFSLTVTGSLESLPSDIELTLSVDDGSGTTRDIILTVNLIQRPYFTVPSPNAVYDFCEDFEVGDVVADDITYMNPTGSTSIAFFVMDQTVQTFVLSRQNDSYAVLSLGSGFTPATVDVESDTATVEFSITIRIVDSSTNDYHDVSVTVTVGDVNDNAPVINVTSESALLQESTSAGYILLSVEVTDADKDAPNNETTLTLEGENSGHFELSGGSLIVSTPSALNYSEVPEYNLTLIAVDNAEAPEDKMTSSVSIIVTIATAPEFVVPSLDEAPLVILESIGALGDLLQLEATDRDGGPNPVSFNIVSVSPDRTDLFTISTSNHLKTGDNIAEDAFDVDAENTHREYNVTISASDGLYSVQRQLTVQVADVNDNGPVFTETSTSVQVPENVNGGYSLLSVEVTDADKDAPNNETTLTLEGENSGHFELSGGSLIVSTPSALNYSEVPEYNLTLIAVDNAEAPEDKMTSSVSIIVTIATGPEFVVPSLDEAPLLILESIGALGDLLQLEATDRDGGPNPVTFNIVSVSPDRTDLFTISDSNHLKTGDNIAEDAFDVDAEITHREYNVTISASDGLYSVQRQLTVQVADVNDNGPVFTETSTSVQVPENVNDVFTMVVATDADADSPNNEVTYSLADDNFAINGSTGEVTAAKTLTEAEYWLSVRATDGGSPANTAFATIQITVNGDTVDECSLNPCKNDATCEPGINVYNCTCATGWSGPQCDINIDDCDPLPCVNGGVCTDLVDDYSCDCQPGWEGVNCNTACSGHTFGRNCNQTCDCNGTNVANSAAAQHCNIQDGACYCSVHWTGTRCNQDVDECSQTAIICTEDKTICENQMGGYECVCFVGYSRTSNAAPCVTDSTDNNQNRLPAAVISGSAGDISVNVTVTMSFQSERCQVLLDRPSTFIPIKAELERQLEEKLTGTDVTVYNLRCGSLSYDVFLSAPNASKSNADLSKDLERLKMVEQLEIEGQNVTVTNMTINNVQIPATNSLCPIYEALSPCGDDYTCQVRDNQPYCQEIKKEKTALILGVGIGVGCIGLLLLMVLGVGIYVMQKRKNSKENYRRSHKKSRSNHSYRESNGSLKPSAYNMNSFSNSYSDTYFYYGANGSRKY